MYRSVITIPAFNPDGSRYLYQRASSGSMPMYAFNVLNEMDNSGDETNGSAINMQAHVSYNVIDDLKLEGTLSYGVSNTNQEIYFTEDTYYVHQLRAEQTVQNDMCPLGGELRKSEVRNTTWMARVQANYAKNVGGEGKHNVSGTEGVD